MTTLIFGEAMLEYHSHGGTGLRYGGDTLNTAIHLARAGNDVAYVTAVGVDPISDALVSAWAGEGIDTRHVLRHPQRHPGIYAVHLDAQGERSFLYWRSHSAACEMFDLPGIGLALKDAEEAELVYFSLISLAIVDAKGREALLGLAKKRKSAGKALAYDSNFRPSLWPDLVTAREATDKAMRNCTIGLPTNTDERELWTSGEDEIAIAARWIGAGCDIVAVKAAEKGCVLSSADEQKCHLIASTGTRVVDSSGAGDSFNAGFLGAWLQGETAYNCVEAGQASARRTLGHQGAIPPRTMAGRVSQSRFSVAAES